MATTKSDKKTMDVSKPGKTAPDTSARPVIVSHKPTMQDPMVKSDDQADETTKPAEAMANSSHKVIQPLTEEGAIKPSDAGETTPEASSEAKPTDDKIAEETAVVDAVVDQANAKKKEADLNDAELKKQEEVAKLIANKKYFVPIGQASKRRNKRASIAILVLLLLLVGAYLTADAGLVDLGIDLPFEIIK